MTNDCIFCMIVKGEIPSYTLYEDEDVKVFLDINPISKGHSLLIPKKHYKTLFSVPENDMDFLKKLPMVARKLKEATEAEGVNIIQSNERAAGQVVFHVHFHLIPRWSNDGIIKFPEQGKLEQKTADEIIEKFKN